MGLGMPEVILILVIALIVFGPRKLPELGKSLGQAMSQFRRASEDFKRTWEQEVDLEKTRSNPDQAAIGSATAASGYSSDYYSYGYEPEYSSGDTTATSSDPAAASATPNAPNQPDSAGTKTGLPGAKTEDAGASPTDVKQHWI